MFVFVDELASLLPSWCARDSMLLFQSRTRRRCCLRQSRGVAAGDDCRRTANKDISELTWASASTILIDDHIALKARSGGGAILSESGGRHGRRNRNNSRKHGTKASAADSSSDDDEAEIATMTLDALHNMESRRGTTVREFCDKPGHELGNCFINPDSPANKLPAKMLERFLIAQGETPSASKDKLARTNCPRLNLPALFCAPQRPALASHRRFATILPFLTAVQLRMCSIRGVLLCLDRLRQVSRVPLRSLTSPW
jgi:hypothetical protein